MEIAAETREVGEGVGKTTTLAEEEEENIILPIGDSVRYPPLRCGCRRLPLPGARVGVGGGRYNGIGQVRRGSPPILTGGWGPGACSGAELHLLLNLRVEGASRDV